MSGGILIVEDHDATRAILKTWLEMAFPQRAIFEAVSGEEAVTLAHLQCLDAILMDIELPGIKGLEAARRIKSDTPGTPIIIVSIHDGDAYRADAAAAGAAYFVSKRAMRTELLPILTAALAVRTSDPEQRRTSG
jgi:DNA-binding NarL/FixJ family response regulator